MACHLTSWPRRSEGERWIESGPDIVYSASATMYLNRREAARQQTRDSTLSAVVLGDPIFARNAAPEPD